MGRSFWSANCAPRAADLPDTILSPANYTFNGFAIPRPWERSSPTRKLRPIVLVGDGAFQMTCLELSTAMRYGFNPIVLVLNNKGYGTERFCRKARLTTFPTGLSPDARSVRGRWGFEVHTEGISTKPCGPRCRTGTKFSLLNIHLERPDVSRPRTAGEEFGKADLSDPPFSGIGSTPSASITAVSFKRFCFIGGERMRHPK